MTIFFYKLFSNTAVINLKRYIIISSRYLLNHLSVSLAFALIIGGCSSSSGPDNRAPGTPSKPAGPLLAVINQPVTYTASSIDSDKNLSKLTFFWDGQDTTVVSLSAGSASGTATHTYSRLGSFQIFVVATDISGLRSDSSAGLRIDVVEPGPLVPTIPEGTDTAFITQRYTFSSTTVSPDGGSMFLTFNWGDGSSTNTSPDTSGAIFNASHIFYDTGSFVIRVEAADDSGRVSPQSIGRTILALNQAPLKPTPPFGPLTAIVRDQVFFRSATADPEGDLFSLRFDWGDGSTTKTALATGDREFVVPHQYLDTGMFAIRVSATDVFANVSDTSQVTMIHIPIFPSDTIQYISSALDKPIVTIQQAWSITWINRDQGIIHTVESTDIDAEGNPAFPAKLLKSGDAWRVIFEDVGTFRYRCANHPSNTAETGRITVR